MSSSLTQTLNSITATKLQVLSKQHTDFNSHSEKILSSLKDNQTSLQRVQLLVDGLESWCRNSTASSFSGTYLQNVKSFLIQAKLDPTIGGAIVNEWETNLKKAFHTEKLKFEYAELFGKLLSEWIASSDPTAADVEIVGRKEMHEQREMFDSHVFTAKETDEVTITAYLEELFSSKAAKKGLHNMREEIGKFSKELLNNTTFTVPDLESAIQALLTADLLSNEKRETLREFTRDQTVLSEVADVLNMNLAALSSWSWAAEGEAIPVEMRRQINGKYRIFMDEEILQAIFLHWVGLKWSVEFKRHFRAFFASAAWKPSTQPLTKEENERREYFLQELPISYQDEGWCQDRTIIYERRRKQQEAFFMSLLPDSPEERGAAYDSDGDEDAKDDPEKPKEKNPVEVKQSLLHILATECLFNTALHNQFTAVQSDFAWFGPSLSHTSIVAVLKFFAVSQPWLTFFQKFLAAPLKFVDDGPSASKQIRKCGVPVSHSLSDFFGEAVLFCMDYAVNQRADGLFLYRIHDDFWWWSHDPSPCVKAWKEMNTFARLVGLKFNAEKTGSVTINQPRHPDLPPGAINWGLLTFSQTGKFEINQSKVDVHIEELKFQLKSCEHSVFAWVQAYNKYMTSIVHNCASPPAHCFGKDHITNVTNTLQRIHLALFPEHSGSVTAHLGDILQTRFRVSDVPTGWYFWPIAMGGMELKSSFIPQFAILDKIDTNPVEKLTKLLESEKERYQTLKEEWDNGTTSKVFNMKLQDEPFLSYEEYVRHGEARFAHWKDCYVELLSAPEEEPCEVKLTERMKAEMEKMSSRSSWKLGSGENVSVYWKWVVSCFGEEMVKKWGGLEVVPPGSLPVGMVEVWKSKKVMWEK